MSNNIKDIESDTKLVISLLKSIRFGENVIFFINKERYMAVGGVSDKYDELSLLRGTYKVNIKIYRLRFHNESYYANPKNIMLAELYSVVVPKRKLDLDKVKNAVNELKQIIMIHEFHDT